MTGVQTCALPIWGTELDEIDRAIIRVLQADGRTPYSKLGPNVGLSQAAVRQRVQRLIDRGVMQIVAVTDPMQLGFARQAMIGIRCTGDTTKVAETAMELFAGELGEAPLDAPA